MKIGIIGTGGIVTSAHIPNYVKAGMDVVAVMNRTRANGERVGHYLGNRPGVGLLGEWDASSLTVEDTARAMVTFENGASLLLDVSYMANIEEKDTMRVKCRGTNAGASLFPLMLHTEKYGALFDEQPAYLTQSDPYERKIQLFLEACREEPSYRQAEEAVILHRIIDHIYA